MTFFLEDVTIYDRSIAICYFSLLQEIHFRKPCLPTFGLYDSFFLSLNSPKRKKDRVRHFLSIYLNERGIMTFFSRRCGRLRPIYRYLLLFTAPRYTFQKTLPTYIRSSRFVSLGIKLPQTQKRPVSSLLIDIFERASHHDFFSRACDH